MGEIAARGAGHPLIPVPPGGGMVSELAGVVGGLDLVRGMDELIGRTDQRLGPAYSRALEGTPGDVTTAQACGRLSGRLYA